MKSDLNAELFQLYQTEIPKLTETLKQIDNLKLEELSWPLLPHIFEDYLSAKTKIVFVGKETHGGWGKLSNQQMPLGDSIKTTIARYIRFDFSKNIDENKWRINSAFWRFCHDIYNSLNNVHKNEDGLLEQKRGFVWLNQSRVDENCTTPKKPQFYEILKWSLDLLNEELKILKPDVIIFMGDQHYRLTSNFYFEALNKNITFDELLSKNKLFKFETDFFNTKVPMFYMFHPERKKTEDIEEVKNIIINIVSNPKR